MQDLYWKVYLKELRLEETESGYPVVNFLLTTDGLNMSEHRISIRSGYQILAMNKILEWMTQGEKEIQFINYAQYGELILDISEEVYEIEVSDKLFKTYILDALLPKGS
jgi:hypothetical protein